MAGSLLRILLMSTGRGSTQTLTSLALLLLECLTGQVVFPGHGVAAAVARLHHPPTIPHRPAPGWAPLLTAMTHPDPADRPTATQVAATLGELARAPAGFEVAAHAAGGAGSGFDREDLVDADRGVGGRRPWWARPLGWYRTQPRRVEVYGRDLAPVIQGSAREPRLRGAPLGFPPRAR